MHQEEKTFTVRFSLEAHFPEDYEGDDDEGAWVKDWEARVMPDVIKSIFTVLRQFPSWSPHIRNRGMAPSDEIEIALVREYSSFEKS